MTPANNLPPVPFLLVDDLEENLLSLEAVLRRDGLQVLKATSAVQALELLLKNEVALALLDVQMPEMDGLEAAQEVCRRLAPANRPFMIALTANAGEGERQRCLDAGMDEYLSKPIRSVSLSAALRSAYTRITEGVSAAS